MTQQTFLSEEQLVTQAIQILVEKLGILETERFLALKTQGRIDSIQRHHLWQDHLDKETFFNDVFSSS
jgi:hypothetical protein